jgi:hypothetical protein
LPYDVKNCNPFSQEAILPLLNQIPEVKVTKDALYPIAISWLESIRPTNEIIEICFDYQTDWDLFYDVLDGRIPPWCNSRLVSRNIDELLRYKFYKTHQLP